MTAFLYPGRTAWAVGLDAQGRPLWSMPGRDGLVPLEVLRDTPEVREAA